MHEKSVDSENGFEREGLRLKIKIDLYSRRPKTDTFKAAVIICDIFD